MPQSGWPPVAKGGDRHPRASPGDRRYVPGTVVRSILALLSLLTLAGCRNERAPAPEVRAAAEPASATTAGVCGESEPVPACGDDTSASGSACATSCGCGSGQQAGELVPAARAKLGDRTRCPVSGGVFVVDQTTVFVNHADKSYPVCCPGCAARFQRDPAKFVGS